MSKRYQMVAAPHVASRLRLLGCKEIENAHLPRCFCALFELDRHQLKVFHALCKGEGWKESYTVIDRIVTQAHGAIRFSYTWSPVPLPDTMWEWKGYRKWGAITESGLQLELPNWAPGRASYPIKSIHDVKALTLRFHANSRVEDGNGTPTGKFHPRLGDTLSSGLTAIQTQEPPFVLFIRQYHS